MNTYDDALIDKRRAVWEQYAVIWKTPDREEKLEMMNTCMTEDNRYQDPLTGRLDHLELADYMVEFHKMVPGGHLAPQQF